MNAHFDVQDTIVMCLRLFFFFQAEDGIRDGHVTGVQTCALPILQPRTPTVRCSFSRLRERNSLSRFHTRVSAFSRIEQVLTKITSASPARVTGLIPFSSRMELTTSVSAKFIWQPYVSIQNLFSLILPLF